MPLPAELNWRQLRLAPRNPLKTPITTDIWLSLFIEMYQFWCQILGFLGRLKDLENKPYHIEESSFKRS